MISELRYLFLSLQTLNITQLPQSMDNILMRTYETTPRR